MNQTGKEEETLRRYVLGELSDSDHERVEESLFTDDNLFNQLLLLEDDLIQDYVQDVLSEKQKEDFEKRFLLSREGRERVAYIKDLSDYASAAGKRKGLRSYTGIPTTRLFSVSRVGGSYGSLLMTSLMLVVLSAVFIGVWQWGKAERLQVELAQSSSDKAALEGRRREEMEQLAQEKGGKGELSAQLEREQAEKARLYRQLKELRASREQETRAAAKIKRLPGPIIPKKGSQRGSGATRENLVLSAIPFHLKLDEDKFDSYIVTVLAPDDEEVWKSDPLKAHKSSAGISINFGLPINRLSAGDYTIILSGVTEDRHLEIVDRYYFKIIEK